MFNKNIIRPLIRHRFAIIIFVCIVVLLSAVFVFLESKNTPTPKYSGPVENISVGTIGEYSSLIFIAQDRGYFRDNGLEVTTKEYESGPPAVADLLAGKIDMTTAADFVGVRNSFNNEDLKILAAMAKVESFFMVVRRDHGIEKPTDLKGKKIGVTSKTAGEYHLGEYLTFNQMTLRDINMVNQPPSQLVELFTKGDIDAIVSFDPHVSKAQSLVGDKASQWSIQSGQNLYPLLYSSGKLTSERPEAVKRYLQALVSAEQFIKSNDAEARAIIIKRLNFDTAYLERVWPRFSFALTLDQEMLIAMENQAHWAIENHLTSATKTPNFLRLIYFEGLQSAKPEGITIIR